VESKAREEDVTSDFGPVPDLTSGQYRNLLEVAALAINHTARDTVSILALKLRRILNIEILTIGLCDPRTDSIDLHLWTEGKAAKAESFPVPNCASGWAWKTQRSVHIRDLDTEDSLPVFLSSLRQLGVRSYYVVPLTTPRRRLGAMGFGSLRVLPESKGTLEFLRRLTALIAPLLETASVSDIDAKADLSQPRSAVTLGAIEERQDCEGDKREREESQEEAFRDILGNSAPLREVLKQARRVATTDATVLLMGETGTGKELVARAIHSLSPRAGKGFITVNCTAIPTELLESELFGHEKGAFTGALNRHIGRLEVADGGTLLLDEVGDLPHAIQPKLLRVLQDKEFERLGSNQTLKVNVRLIAATNHDLHQSVAEGRFRGDLFYRLNVFPIYVPPLRERKSDIPALVTHFVSRYANEMKKPIETIPAEAMEALVNWGWPGNIRELQNLIQRCVILSDSPVLKVLLGELGHHANRASGKLSEATQRDLIIRALRETGGTVGGPSGAARRLGMKRTTLYSKMKKLNINPADFQASPP
jgi:formate hydrogenlyase transcriptional activator